MHCIAYSCGARSEGIDTFGRTSYLLLGISRDLAIGKGGGGWFGSSLEPSLSTGVVALLDKVDNGDESSEWSERTDVDDPKDEFLTSSVTRATGWGVSAFGCGVEVGGLFLEN
jgi:hypothetical protein